ncbi:MAG: hypothetical protein ACR2JC_10795 [Chloroflexota bacterium]|nr:MAG: hypothetical protein DLM70_07015 [Chloroflexota bacterium]
MRVFVLAFVVYAYFMPRWADWNIDSRLDLVHAIVHDRSLRIDRYHWNTWDKAVVRDPRTHVDHFYSDKAPGTAFLGAPVYAAYTVARQAPVLGAGIHALLKNDAWKIPLALGQTSTQKAAGPRGNSLGGCQRSGAGSVQYIPWGNRLAPFPSMKDWALSKYVVSVGAVAFPSALFTAFFFWFLSLFARSRRTPWLVTGLYAFCTVALPYSTNFYSHQLAAGALFTAFALLYLWRRKRGRTWYPAISGFLLGFAFFTEYTVLMVAGVVFLYALPALWNRRGMLGSFLLAGALPVLGLLAYNKAAFGSALDTGYSHDFCWSSAQAAGLAGFTYPHGGPLYDLTLGSFRGLFYLSPFLLLAFPGAVLAWRRRVRLEPVVCLLLSAAFIVLLSAYWGWNGGKVEGPRYLVPIVPFLAFPCVFVFDLLEDVPQLWLITLPAVLWSAFATWSEFLGGALFPISWWPDPVFQYSLPHLKGNDIAPNAGMFLGLNGWLSLAPLAALLLAAVMIPPWRRRTSRESISVFTPLRPASRMR